jgi:putative ABC transport system substrate-binding protein
MRRRNFLRLVGGTVVTWPSVARAQQPAIPVIGFLNGASPGGYAAYVAAFRDGLRETGFIERQNVVIEYRWAEGRYDRLPALAADLAGRHLAVIAATGVSQGAIAAKAATTTIPIVFSTGFDPVKLGLVSNLARPDGNLTGVGALNVLLGPKRLELLQQLVPNSSMTGFLTNLSNPNTGSYITEVQEAGRTLGLEIKILNAGSEQEIDLAFANFAKLGVGALLIATENFFISRREQLITLATQYKIPTLYENRDFVTAGGLISYGPSLTDIYRQVGIYVGRILKGAKPADLPVIQPAKFELVINRNTAKTLGLTVPPALLVRADEVIE